MNVSQVKGFLQTQELWNDTFNGIPQFKFPELNLIDFRLQPIPKNIRLGHQIEYIFQQLIAHSTSYKTLLFNQPIRNEKITTGEIDFILQNTKNQEIIHVELTYKFYIIDTNISDEIHQLVGPNRKDAFYEKVQKIKHKQFALLKTKEAIQFLESKHINVHNIISKACFKAQLFKPYFEDAILKTLNENCIVGSWLSLNEFKLSLFNENLYYLLKKQEWIIVPTFDVEWKIYQSIIGDIYKAHERKQAPMLWMKDKNNKLHKIFIVR
ncbi:DUF1853 family protein [Cellulophaga sp. E16_2]|uniref:DUF1853 family protein n=1 Tax=Cellulophaga sp. E16_2 TaxID=2789297 RepID=UPI001A9192D6|nr:DUF1853 family protein [Cellulophaga sp. E16_2]MBO0593761.1 DUF1853 family protein [Cellulophaga sp. E16_2]